ncbi:MAG: hypothetical protein JW840_09945 [Candidatus Thermoplasmatota archaeon]|nr:hypothetical protein [Candidatus Thermoplasmatota archaeon]
MISLKKNDKIIIIAAVVILVLAGVGVAMYQSPKTSEIPLLNTIGENEYQVIWTVQNGSLSPISDYANKKSMSENTVMIPEGNIKSVTFDLQWTDDRMTVFKRMGLDSLTLEITTPDGFTTSMTNTSARKTGAGSITITVDTGKTTPPTSIKETTEQAAQLKLKQSPYYDNAWTDKNIYINVSVKVGEIRLLKQLRDKGNDYELSITYQYYHGILRGDVTKTTGDDMTTPPEDDPWADEVIPPPYVSMIIQTGCGRFV